MKQNLLFCWSGGKDSALALHEIMKSGDYSVQALLTTVTQDYDRISMHGVRCGLLEKQSDALSLPVEKMFVSSHPSNEEYEKRMNGILARYRENGTSHVAFGDIFLEDLRTYRENNLAGVGMKAVFPLWKKNSTELALRFIDSGFKAIITCVDTKLLDRSFSGREYDRTFLSELPASVDPCGENGEFHSFVYAGPIFNKEIPVKQGEITLRDGQFCFCDLMPL